MTEDELARKARLLEIPQLVELEQRIMGEATAEIDRQEARRSAAAKRAMALKDEELRLLREATR